MNKLKFLEGLRTVLSGSDMPLEELDEHLAFYAEMIDDRMEEGLSEDAAVSEMGTVDEIGARILKEVSASGGEGNKTSGRKRKKIWEILLLVLGSPVWIAVLAAVFAVAISLYISAWSVVISLWAAFGGIVGCAFGGMLSGAVLALTGNVLLGIAFLGAALVCCGLSILSFYGCKGLSVGMVCATKKMVAALKMRLGKEG